ncbi:hypothetical protein [Reinekea thalattae]|uniref:Uncharacterized protein n=1 Tax=Reinekea thalattae TaxID=2593301 RepID=A0A5C8ZBU0_9GAMM|nr:hypothetical protein [Reinekea thalattae]TXR54668.1 hypothetical protein FME95_09060 [Reinekea thalattae]
MSTQPIVETLDPSQSTVIANSITQTDSVASISPIDKPKRSELANNKLFSNALFDTMSTDWRTIVHHLN